MNASRQNNSDSILYWIGLSSIPGVGRVTFRKIAAYFGSPERGLSASQKELKEVPGLSEKICREIATYPWRENAEQEIAKAAHADVAIVIMDDQRYPASLRRIPDPPLYLYVKGSFQAEDDNALAIVGTRKPTHYGKTVARQLAFHLASAGFTIVSGLARGIDTQAHRGALDAQGRTIGVLGCGIDLAYPAENKGLIEEMTGRGAVITENPFGTQPEAGFFPARNRIISGLSRGVVIIEATEDSGSLITARNAIEQGRKLFAVPGNIGSVTSKGPNTLIKQGATLVESPEDIVKELGADGIQKNRNAKPLPPLNGEEEDVLQRITNEPKHIDIIMNECGSPAGKLGGILTALELKGLAKQLPGKYFVRRD